jgi:cell division protease FtsH
MLNLEKIFQSLEMPCIVFIDEIDAILGSRSATNKSGEDIKIINAFLQYMDGFRTTQDILFIGATNRIESIDDALLRAGRFDSKILV